MADEREPLPDRTLERMEMALFLGQTALNKRDYARAFEFFSLAARTYHPKAINMLGRVYERGWGVSRNIRLAMTYFEYAARKGEGWADFNLGDLYLSGEGLPVDPQKAFSHYLRAACKGVNKALNMLGVLCEQGVASGEKDIEAARLYYKAGSEAGDYWASYNMGRLCLSERNYREAEQWFRLAITVEFPGCYEALRKLLGEESAPCLRALRSEICFRLEKVSVA